MKIGIIGGGILGLSLAYYLQKKGHGVHVYESNSFLGGLAGSFDYGSFIWDKFYHVILPQDAHLLELLKEIGLEKDLRWRNTGTGYYGNGKFYAMSNTRQMLQFPLLSWSHKIRMGLATLYTVRLAQPERLYRITAKDWLINTFGPSNYEVFWRPLLRAKFGIYAEKVAAVFIWASLKRLYGARSGLASKESMGYVHGGYHHILATLRRRLEAKGGRIFLGVKVHRIGMESELSVKAERYCEAVSGQVAAAGLSSLTGTDSFRADHENQKKDTGRCGIQLLHADHEMEVHWFDKVVFTAPKQLALPILSARLRKQIENLPGQDSLPSTYLGVVCLNVVLRRPLTPYYVLNIADQRLALTGVIEMTSLIDASEETGGLSLVYLPRYVDSNSPFLGAEDGRVYDELFTKGLNMLFPDLSPDDIVSWHVQRAKHVQALPLVRETVPPSRSGLLQAGGEFVLANTSLLTCATLNNSEVIGLAKEIAAGI